MDTLQEAGNWTGRKIGVHPITHDIYAPDIIDGNLRIFNNTNYTLIKTIQLGDSLDAVDFNPSQNLAYVVGEEGDRLKLWVVDGSYNVIREIDLGSGESTDVAFNPTSNKIYVTTWAGGNKLYIIDANSYGVTSLNLNGNSRGVL